MPRYDEDDYRKQYTVYTKGGDDLNSSLLGDAEGGRAGTIGDDRGPSLSVNGAPNNVQQDGSLPPLSRDQKVKWALLVLLSLLGTLAGTIPNPLQIYLQVRAVPRAAPPVQPARTPHSTFHIPRRCCSPAHLPLNSQQLTWLAGLTSLTCLTYCYSPSFSTAVILASQRRRQIHKVARPHYQQSHSYLLRLRPIYRPHKPHQVTIVFGIPFSATHILRSALTN